MRKPRQILTMISCTLIALVAFSAQAANLIAFIASDTLDDYVGKSVSIDFDHIRKEMKKVASQTGLTLKEVLLQGKDNNTQKFLETLNALHADKDDVIVFYYAGHGYRTPSKGDIPWPNLVFTQEKNGDHKGIQYEYVMYHLMEQHPRLLITIADVCNNVIRENRAPPIVTKALAAAPNLEKIRANYKHLYLDEAGMINITSAKIGEVAYGDEDDGGAFTIAFLNSVKYETERTNSTNWRTIIQNASNKVTQDAIDWAIKNRIPIEEAEKDGDIQHPYFEILTTGSPG